MQHTSLLPVANFHSPSTKKRERNSERGEAEICWTRHVRRNFLLFRKRSQFHVKTCQLLLMDKICSEVIGVGTLEKRPPPSVHPPSFPDWTHSSVGRQALLAFSRPFHPSGSMERGEWELGRRLGKWISRARTNDNNGGPSVIGGSRYRRKHLVVTCPLETQRSRNKEKRRGEGVTQRGSCPAPVRGGKGFWKEGRKVGRWRVTSSPGHVAIFLFEKGRPVGGRTGGWRYGGSSTHHGDC